MLTIRFDGSATERYLDALGKKLSNPETLLKSIGEDVTQSTRERFKTATTPDRIINQIMSQEAARYEGAGQLIRTDTPQIAAIVSAVLLGLLVIIIWRLYL